jgi:DNA-directed RNA polymerase specialized sigma24 family protein
MKAEITNQSSPVAGNQNDIIEACKRGDHKAQLMVYKLYYRPLYNSCLHLVNDPAAAEDIMHESFLSAFENIGNYSGETNFFSWLNSFIKYIE